MSKQHNRKYYDESFAEVFSNRKMIESLLRDFIAEPWVHTIDFGSMTIERSLFKEISREPRLNDLLFSFKLQPEDAGDNPVEARIFLLIEFQSTPVPMRRRLLEYRARLHSRLLEQGKIAVPVVPIVIYNGGERWKEHPQDSENLCGASSYVAGLEKYVPTLRYFLIDEQRYSDAYLLKKESPAASFFYLDKTDLKKRDEAAARIINTLTLWKKKDLEIYDLLKRYIIGLMRYKGVEIAKITDYTDERGIPMLAQSMDELIEQGELLEKQKVLVRQLNKRFGLTDAETALIMAETSREKLDQALDEILFAENKEQVFQVLQ